MKGRTKVLGIAPYEELRYAMESVGATFSTIEIDTYTGDLQEGKKLTLELIEDDYDIVVSRGGTADLIRDAISKPVIDVSISVYDILAAIKLANNYTSTFAIVGYPSITETAHLICDVLDYSIEIYTITDSSDNNALLNSLKERGIELVLCDAVTNKLALELGLNTILITSGNESIKNALKQAIEINYHLQQLKMRNDLLVQAAHFSKNDILITSDNFDIIHSSLDNDTSDSIIHYLSNRKEQLLEAEQHTLYHSINNNLHTLKVKTTTVIDKNFYITNVQKAHVPIVNSKFGVIYEEYSKVEKELSNNLYKKPIITEETTDTINQIKANTSPVIVLGEKGTGKSIVSQNIFTTQTHNNNTLITINSNLFNDTMWKHLLNTNSGPFVEVGNTILFDYFDKITPDNFERLISIIETTKLHHSNRLIFNCEISYDGITSDIYEALINRLDCLNIVLPTLRDRKHELPAILTMTLNKVNIEKNTEIIGYEPQAVATLAQYTWPRNFTQLKQIITELVYLSKSLYISNNNVMQVLEKQDIVDRISFSEEDMSIAFSRNKTLHDFNLDIIQLVLNQHDGNQTEAAKQLGISRTTLWRYLNK